MIINTFLNKSDTEFININMQKLTAQSLIIVKSNWFL